MAEERIWYVFLVLKLLLYGSDTRLADPLQFSSTIVPVDASVKDAEDSNENVYGTFSLF